MPNYKLGTTDPTITPDPGAGTWNGTPTEMATHAKKAAILAVLGPALVYPGDDAVKHMLHYLGISGADYTIDLRGMVDEVPSAKTLFDSELEVAKRFVETLPVGIHDICSADLVQGYNTKSENANWFFAIGGYSVWGKGTATVSVVNGSQRAYRLIFRYHFFDRYNWDGGKSVTIGPITITDHVMGEFHRQGVAKEFDCKGVIEELATWGAPIPVPAPAGPVAPPQPAPPQPKPAPPKPPAAPSTPKPAPVPKIHVVKPGDNLSMIAQKYYGTPNDWPKIYAANKSRIGSNPNLIHAGQHLVIP